MFDEWAKAISAANGLDSGNIYQNFARAGAGDATGASAAGRHAAIQAGIDDTSRRENAAAAEATAKLAAQREEDAKDPGKATMQLRKDHQGYDFFDGTGKAITINDFSLLTGKKPDQILENSDSQYDQKFVSDYRTMRDLAGAWVNGDTATLAKYRANDPKKFNELVTTYKSPQEMVKGFMTYYSNYYGGAPDTNNNSTRFSPGEQAPTAPGAVAPVPNPKNPKVPFGVTDLAGVTAPQNDAKPTPGSWMDQHNPFSGRKSAIRDWQKRHQQDPWAIYYDSLMGR